LFFVGIILLDVELCVKWPRQAALLTFDGISTEYLGMSDPEANGHGLLFTVNSVEWKRLPSWADFFFSVGRVLQLEPRTGTRAVLGVALPSRSFAAALAATGGVVTYLKANLESVLLI
jgi:hypothetical protein